MVKHSKLKLLDGDGPRSELESLHRVAWESIQIWQDRRDSLLDTKRTSELYEVDNRLKHWLGVYLETGRALAELPEPSRLRRWLKR